jgi:hypothetical protein
MAQIIREISVDVARENTFSAIVAKQNDSNSRFLKVTLKNEGEPLEIASSSIATINALREDGTAEAFLGTVNEDGTVTVPLSNWMLALDGTVKCDVTIVDTDSRKLTTTMFTLSVEESAYEGTDVSDDPNYDLLIALLADCATTKENCDNATTAATAATAQAETATESANSAAEAANNAISSIMDSNNLLLALNSDGSLTLKLIDTEE